MLCQSFVKGDCFVSPMYKSACNSIKYFILLMPGCIRLGAIKSLLQHVGRYEEYPDKMLTEDPP